MTSQVFVHVCQGNKFDASSEHQYFHHFWVLRFIDMKVIEIGKHVFTGILPLKMIFGHKNDVLLLKYVFNK